MGEWKHVNVPVPTQPDGGKKSGKGLKESMVAVADAGSHIGDPRNGMQRRVAEIQGAYQTGTVKVPRKGDKGRTKLVDVPATEENVRASLEYWRTRKPRTAASRAAQNDNVSALTRRLEAMMAAQTVRYSTEAHALVVMPEVAPATMRAAESPEGRTRHVLAGPALVQGPNMAPVQKMWRNPLTGVSEPAAARLDGSLTERLDRTVADERDKGRFTASQRRNWRRKQARIAARNAE
jgi:hypothetical protein